MGSRGRNERTSGFYVVGERVLSYLYTPRPVRFSFYVMRLGLACRLLCVSLTLFIVKIISLQSPLLSSPYGLSLSPFPLHLQRQIPTYGRFLSLFRRPPMFLSSSSLPVASRSTGLVLDAVSLLLVCRSPLWVAERCALWAVSARVRARWARAAVCDVAII